MAARYFILLRFVPMGEGGQPGHPGSMMLRAGSTRDRQHGSEGAAAEHIEPVCTVKAADNMRFPCIHKNLMVLHESDFLPERN